MPPTTLNSEEPVMSIWAKWMVRRVTVLAANAFVCA